MAVKSTESEMEGWQKVLDQTTRKLKKYLIPDEIIHLQTGFELFDFTDRRDIQVNNKHQILACFYLFFFKC
jgi:hypothetical protein